MLNDIEKNLLSRAALGDLITRSAIKRRTRTALVSGNQRISYAELNQKSCRAANAFLKMGMPKRQKANGLES